MRNRNAIAIVTTVLLAAAWSVAVPGPPQEPLWGWTFDDGTASATYGYVDGAMQSGVTSEDTIAMFGKSMAFDGTLQGVIDLAAGVNLSTSDDWTISAWVYSTGDGNKEGTIFGNWFSGTQNILLQENSLNVRVLVRTEGDGSTITANSTALSRSTWEHVVITYHGVDTPPSGGVNDGMGTVILYTDGANQEQLNTADVMEGWDPDGLYRIGGSGGDVKRYLQGYIDDVALWRVVLSPENVEWLYNSGSGRSISEIPAGGPAPPPFPDWAWAFDDGVGTTAAATFGDVAGTLDGGANTTWETDAVDLLFQYPGNAAIEFSGGIANDSQVLLDDGAGTDKINISGGNNNAFTVSLWAYNKDGSGNGNRASLFGNWFTGVGQCILLQTPDSAAHQFNANARQASDDTLTISGTCASDVWQHYVFVFDGAATHAGTAELFIDGVSAASSVSADVLENWADEGQYRIGGDSRGNNVSKNRNYMFQGLIDEVAVWQSALSSDSIAWLYNDGAGRSVTQIPASGTVIVIW